MDSTHHSGFSAWGSLASGGMLISKPGAEHFCKKMLKAIRQVSKIPDFIIFLFIIIRFSGISTMCYDL
jgi:hypothetical protein